MQKVPTILETKRLRLRYQRHSDIPFLVALWADPKVTAFLGGPRDRDWLRSVFEQTAQNPTAERFDLWPVEEKETGHLVGHCGLLEKDIEGKSEIELNYVLAPTAWGKGYASEVGQSIAQYGLQGLGLQRLIALIEPQNEPSKRVAISVGMRLDKEVTRPGGAVRLLYVLEREHQIGEGPTTH